MKKTGKSKKKNRLLVVIILIAVAALLIAGYFIADGIKKKRQEEEERRAEEEAEAQSVMLTSHTLDEVKSVFYSYQGYSVEIELENGIYYIKNDHDFPLDQSEAKVIANQYASVKSKRLLENTRSNFSAYGLGNPDYIVKVTYTDGSELNFAAGIYNSSVDAYYVNILDTYSVYLLDPLYISTLELDMKKLFYTTDEINVKSEDVKKVEAVYSGNAENETDCVYTYNSSESKWIKSINGADSDDGDKNAEYIIKQITSLSFDDYAGYAVGTDTELSQYGLLDPYATVTLTYNDSVTAEDGTVASVEKSVTVRFGVFNGKAYFMPENSDIVYSIKADSVDGIITANIANIPSDTTAVDTIADTEALESESSSETSGESGAPATSGEESDKADE